MAYTESREDAEAYGRELMALCPKGYAWLVGDCDFDGDCNNCQVPDAPIKSDSVRTCSRCGGSGRVEDTCNHLAFFKVCELCDGVGKIPIESDKGGIEE